MGRAVYWGSSGLGDLLGRRELLGREWELVCWMALGSGKRALRRRGAGLLGERTEGGRLLLLSGFVSVLVWLVLAGLFVSVLVWLVPVCLYLVHPGPLVLAVLYPVTISVPVGEISAVTTDPTTRGALLVHAGSAHRTWKPAGAGFPGRLQLFHPSVLSVLFALFAGSVCLSVSLPAAAAAVAAA